MLNKLSETNSLSISLLDTQNKKVIELINDLILAQQNGTSHLIIAEVLSKIVDYAEYHFSMEEDMMRKCKYPNLDEHIKEHAEFKLDISQFIRDSQKGILMISLKTLRYLKDWSMTHILSTDRELRDYLSAKELGNYHLHEIALN